MFAEVPVLPVVAPLAAVVLAVILENLRRHRLLSARRAAVAVAVCVYAAGVAANTVFPIFLDKPRGDLGWGEHLNVVPIAGYEVADAVMNVLVFVPLGVVIPLVAPRLGWRGAWGVAAAVSLTIESTQYVTATLLGGGHLADVNDLVFNVVGGVVGSGALLALCRLPGVDRVIDGFRWTRPEGRGADTPETPETPGVAPDPSRHRQPSSGAR